jgi:hypothetical protein
MNNINIKFEYGTTYAFEHTDKNGARYSCVSKCVEILFGEQTPYKGWEVHNNRIRIVKEGSEFHNRFIHHGGNCHSAVWINIEIKNEEITHIESQLNSFIKQETCEKCYRLDRHTLLIECSEQVAIDALKKVVEVSKGVFGANDDHWINEAKDFILNAPGSVAIPALEAKIRRTLGDQKGAMNLLEDLKQKTYNSKVETILNNLLNGEYGNFSGGAMPCYKLVANLKSAGFDDLVPFAYDDRYDHDGPNREENVKNLFKEIDQIFKGKL